MGIIRWTAKGLKLAGDILDSEDVEKWLMAKGQSYIEKKLTDLPAKWILGRSRAKRAARNEMLGVLNGNTALRSALETELARLPEILLQATKDIRSRGPSELRTSTIGHNLVACPRGIVITRYIAFLVKALANSAVLQQYVGLPEQFLETAAKRSEEAYFREEKREDLDTHSFVSGADRDFPWDIGECNGHYYVAYFTYASDKLSDKIKRRDLTSFAQQTRKDIESALVSADTSRLSKIRQQLANI